MVIELLERFLDVFHAHQPIQLGDHVLVAPRPAVIGDAADGQLLFETGNRVIRRQNPVHQVGDKLLKLQIRLWIDRPDIHTQRLGEGAIPFQAKAVQLLENHVPDVVGGQVVQENVVPIDPVKQVLMLLPAGVHRGPADDGHADQIRVLSQDALFIFPELLPHLELPGGVVLLGGGAHSLHSGRRLAAVYHPQDARPPRRGRFVLL